MSDQEPSPKPAPMAQKGAPKQGKANREQRLAQALRANLRRRKAAGCAEPPNPEPKKLASEPEKG